MTERTRTWVPDTRTAAAGLRASGIIGAVGLGFLVAMYAAFAAGARSAGMALGWVNDVTAVVTLPLALPGMLALHARLRPTAGRAGDVLLVVGVGSSGAIVVLQLLLVTGALTFEQQVGPVMVAYLGLGTWLVTSSWLGHRAGVLDFGAGTGAFAALYVGYPVWAFRLARQLAGTSTEASLGRVRATTDA
jgi:hypothetical protein